MTQEEGTTPPEHIETSQPRTMKKEGGESPLTHETVTPASSEESQISSSQSKSSEEAASLISLPEEFGRYRIKKLLGAGSMGAVYLAEDLQLQRQVALKTPSFTGDKPELLERFYREARSAATLDNKNICTVFDVGEIDETHYISMAYVEGRPLTDYIDSKKLQSSRQIAKLIRKVSLALHEAHEAGVVHRDLKPDNIMVNTKQEPVIMDFGLAFQANLADARMTSSGTVMGTPAYMSPEQVCADLDAIGPSSDQFSLGVILYEMMCGERPFSGSVGVVMSLILNEAPANPATVQSEVDPALEAICLRMMEKEQEDRYDSMKDVAIALTSYLEQTASTPSLQKKTKSGSSKKVILSIGAALLGIFLLAGIMLMLQTSDGTVIVELKEGVSDDIKIEVTQNGKVHIAEKKNDWTITIVSGKYQLSVQGGDDRFALNQDEVVITRNQKQIVTVKLKPKKVDDSKTAKPLAKETTKTPKAHVATFIGHTSHGISVVISPDGKMGLTTGYDKKAFLWDLETKKLIKKIDFESITLDGQFSTDGKQFVVSERNKKVTLWDIQKEGSVKKNNQFEITPYTRLFFTPDNKSFVVSGYGYWFRLIDIKTEKIKFEQKIEEEDVAVDGFALSPDGQSFASGGTSQLVKVWNLQTGEMTAELKGAACTVRTILFSADGKYLFAAGGKEEDEPNQLVITMWEIETNKLIRTFKGHQGTVFSLGILPDGKRLISSSQAEIKPFIWDIKTGKKLGEIPYIGENLLRFALSPDGKHLLTRDSDKNVYYLNISELE